MKKDTTLKNIASDVGLSVTTVSRVLNGKSANYRISKKSEDLILKRAKTLNYSPNQIARGLRLSRTYSIAYIIPDISNPFFSSIAKSIEKTARKFGYSILLCDSEENTEIEIKIIKMMMDRKVDGLIFSPVGVKVSHLEDISKKKIPMVLLDRYFPNLHVTSVTSDNYHGAFEAVSLVIENGHRRIACIQGLRNTSPNTDRLKGYLDAHSKHNIPVDERLIVGNSFGEQNGYYETKQLLKMENMPSAIFAVSNLISLGSLRALAEYGLNVPDEMSMISFDDQPYSSLLSTPMTTVAQESSQIGQIATKLLLDQINSTKKLKSQEILIPTHLIVRDSVKKIRFSKTA